MMGSTFLLSPIILQKVREVVAFLPSLILLAILRVLCSMWRLMSDACCFDHRATSRGGPT